jgi:hypothetical protein
MGPDGVRQLVPATTAPTAIVAAVGYSLEVEELVVKLTQEGEDDAIDELAVDGPEGKPWHPSPSPCMHALHAFPSPTDPGKNGDGPSAKILFGFKLDDIHAWSQVGVAGWSMHKLNRQRFWTLFVFFADHLFGRTVL